MTGVKAGCVRYLSGGCDRVLDQCNLGKNRFVLPCAWRAWSIVAGKAGSRISRQPHHVSTVRKQGEADAGDQLDASLLFSLEPQPLGST